MTLRLNGDTSGFAEIKAPNEAGDNSITLPLNNGSANQLLQNSGTAGALQYTSAGGGLHYDSSGRLLLGTSTARTNFYGSLASNFQVQGTSFSALSSHTTAGNGAFILSRGTVINGSTVGNLSWQGDDGSTLVEAASITGRIAGAPGSSVMPGKILFSTNSGGAGTTPRVEIASNGALKLLSDCPGIDFSGTNTDPQSNATTLVETLDAYEEGSFVPVLNTNNGLNAPTYSLNNNRSYYRKVGSLVFFNIDINLNITAQGSGTHLNLTLPFSAYSSNSLSLYGQGPSGRDNTAWNKPNHTVSWYFDQPNRLFLYCQNDTGSFGEAGAVNCSDLNTGNRRINISGFYYGI